MTDAIEIFGNNGITMLLTPLRGHISGIKINVVNKFFFTFSSRLFSESFDIFLVNKILLNHFIKSDDF